MDIFTTFGYSRGSELKFCKKHKKRDFSEGKALFGDRDSDKAFDRLPIDGKPGHVVEDQRFM